MMIHRWMKGALKRARRKAAAFASHRQKGREASKGRDSRDTRGMKGWRPSACPKARNRFGLFCARILCRISDRSGLSFSKRSGSRAHVPEPWTPGFPFRALAARSRRVGQMAPTRPRSRKRRQPFTPTTRPEEPQTTTEGATRPGRTSSAPAAAAPSAA